MKKLSIEEKAKAYDEAIHRASGFRTQEYKDVAEYIFPELAESEDERIRKELIFYFQEEISQCSIQEHADKMKEFIAWLEKQGEEIIPLEQIILNVWELGNYWKELTKGFCNTKYGTQLDYIAKHWKEGEHYIKSLKKQGEQKPADKIEPRFKARDKVLINGKVCTIKLVNEDNYIVNENGRDIQEHFSYTKDWKLIGQSFIWSEEDETGLNDALWAIKQARTIAKDENDMGNLWYAERWLKSLKNKVRSK